MKKLDILLTKMRPPEPVEIDVYLDYGDSTEYYGKIVLGGEVGRIWENDENSSNYPPPATSERP